MPPPPPPPGAPPPPSLPKAVPPAGKSERKDLLKDIQRGRKLKPTQTNDRSAPLLGGKNAGPSGQGARPAAGGSASPAAGASTAGASGNAGPLPGIGGLFAGGMPTLKKSKGGINTGRSYNGNFLIHYQLTFSLSI